MIDKSLPAISKNVSLDNLNTFAVKAVAASFVQIDNLQQLIGLQNEISEYKRRLVLGGGSNVLFVNDYSGLIIYPQLKGIKVLKESDTGVTVEVAASENWHDLVSYCVAKGYFGLENLALIPGTVGAAPVQNIGAYGVEVERFITKVDYFDFDSGRLLSSTNKACQFSYRDSFFKRAGQGRYLVTSVEFELSKSANCILTYQPLKEYFAPQTNQVTPQQVFERVCAIRAEKLPDPAKLANAGSFFKNPVVSQQQYNHLKDKFVNLVAYPVLEGDEQSYKVAAGWLIDSAGFKGKTYDKIGVYSKQALVLVNYSDEDGSNILTLANKITQKIKQIFQIDLEAEVRIIK